MSYPFNLFNTIKTISVEKLRAISNIFDDVTKLKNFKKPFYINDADEIKKYILNNKLNIKNLEKLKVLENLSSQYFYKILLVEKNIEKFSRDILYYNDIINNNNISIDKYLTIFKELKKNINFNSINTIEYKQNLFYNNPINSKNFSFGFLDKSLLDLSLANYQSINNIYDKDLDKIKLSLDIQLQGDIINLSLPSIGLIDNVFSSSKSNNNTNYLDFFKFLMNNKQDNIEIGFKLPFKAIDLGDTLSEILLSKSMNRINIINTINTIKIDRINNLENFNIYEINNITNENTKELLINLINKIEINFENILYNSKKKLNNTNLRTNTRSNKKILKKEYIIPYKINHETKKIELMKKIDIEKIKDYHSLIESNNKLIKEVFENTFQASDKTEGIKNLEKENYKNILFSYLFFIIHLSTSILKEYLDKIDNILKNLLDSNERRFNLLNIKDGFAYTSLLKKSLLKFKMILLNNLYYLFLPSKINSGNYGMKLNDFNCFIPEGQFLNSNEKILDEYPINKFDSKTNEFIFDNDRLKRFLLKINNKNDIYKSDIKLEFGGFVFNKNIQKKTLIILSQYFEILLKNNKFNIFIIEIIINNFKINKYIPYELVNELEKHKILMQKSNLLESDRANLEKILLSIFEINIEKSTKYYLKLLEVRKRKNNNILINKLEDFYNLCYIITFNKSMSIFTIYENTINDTKLKNSLLKSCLDKKNYYFSIIKEKLN
jgi:hypothetical protein